MAIDYSVFAGLSCAQPKGPSRLEVKTAKDKADDKAAEAFRAAVWARDGQTCRACRRKVTKSLELTPKRGEVHHLAKRSRCKALLTDARNGVLVCATCHEDLERHRLTPVGTAAQMFTLPGQTGSFLDASCPLRFIRK